MGADAPIPPDPMNTAAPAAVQLQFFALQMSSVFSLDALLGMLAYLATMASPHGDSDAGG